MDIVRKPQPKKALPARPTRRRPVPPRSQKKEDVEKFDDYIKRTRIADKKKPRKKIKNKGKKFFWIAVLIFCASFSYGAYSFYMQTNTALDQISDSPEKHSLISTLTNITNARSYEKLRGFDTGRINILLLGRANSHKSGKDLTDTIMLASIDTKKYALGLFSLPRDLLVSNGDHYVKINSRYQTGVRQEAGAKYIIDSVKDVTGQEVHYYFVMDFEGFIEVIDTLEGIHVDVPQHIRDERYPGPGYSYETFEVFPGLQKFDGQNALKYARTRHDIEGDFGRAKRQQQIMQAARNKAFSIGTVTHPLRITEIIRTLGDHVHTDISPNEIEPFISLMKKVDTHNINNVVADAWKPGSLLISARYYSASGGISGLVPRIGSYREIHNRNTNIFDLNKIKQRQQDITGESPTITLINTTDQQGLALRVKKTLRLIGFSEVTIDITNDEEISDTIIYDNSDASKPFSLDELLKKLRAQKASETIEDYETDFVIFLGNDILDIYNYTAISQEALERDNAQTND